MLGVNAGMLRGPAVGYQHTISDNELQSGAWNLRNRNFVAPYRAPPTEYWSYVQLRKGTGDITPNDQLKDWGQSGYPTNGNLRYSSSAVRKPR